MQSVPLFHVLYMYTTIFYVFVLILSSQGHRDAQAPHHNKLVIHGGGGI